MLTKLITFANRKRRTSQTLNYLNIVARCVRFFISDERRKTFFGVKLMSVRVTRRTRKPSGNVNCDRSQIYGIKCDDFVDARLQLDNQQQLAEFASIAGVEQGTAAMNSAACG